MAYILSMEDDQRNIIIQALHSFETQLVDILKTLKSTKDKRFENAILILQEELLLTLALRERLIEQKNIN